MPYFLVTDDYDLPITNMIDIAGDETLDPEEATIVVGPLPNGEWYARECKRREIVERKPH